MSGPYYVGFYRTARGEEPAREFLRSLPKDHRVKFGGAIDLLEAAGPNLHRPWADVIDGPIRELRVTHGRDEYRVLYFIEGSEIILTHGFRKKAQALDPGEIERARRHRLEWLNRGENKR